jgi:hypothetical protein
MIVPNRNSQNESALSRGKAISAAPIWSGTRKLAKPAAIGVPKTSIIIEPWSVNSSLYACSPMSWSPGWASSRRMSSASTPAMRNAANAVPT